MHQVRSHGTFLQHRDHLIMHALHTVPPFRDAAKANGVCRHKSCWAASHECVKAPNSCFPASLQHRSLPSQRLDASWQVLAAKVFHKVLALLVKCCPVVVGKIMYTAWAEPPHMGHKRHLVSLLCGMQWTPVGRPIATLCFAGPDDSNTKQ